MERTVLILAILVLSAPIALAEPVSRSSDDDGTHYTGIATQGSEDHDEDWYDEPRVCLQVFTDYEYTLHVGTSTNDTIVSITVAVVEDGNVTEETHYASAGETIAFNVTQPTGCDDFVVRGENVPLSVDYEVVTRAA